MASTLLTIPENKRVVFGKFAAAIIDKPEKFEACWEILIKHSDRAMLSMLISSKAQDLIYTAICYLPAKVQPNISKVLAKNPDIRARVLTECQSNQQALRMAIKDKIDAGDENYVGLRVVA